MKKKRNRDLALEEVYKAFTYFANDFNLKKQHDTEIYFAMDNDVFSFSLFPQEKLNYVNLFEDEDKSFLSFQATQFAYGIRKLAKKEQVVILPSHSQEYHATILVLLGDLLKQNYVIEDIPQNAIDEAAKLIKDNNNIEKIIDILAKKAPEIQNALFKFNSANFAKTQVAILFSESQNALQPFDSLLDPNIGLNITKTFILNDISFNFQNKIKTYNKNRKSPFALENDVRALELLIAFNYQETNKKLILITGDRSLHKTYKDFHNQYLSSDDLYAVRHPKHFLPFLTGDGSIFTHNHDGIINKFTGRLNEYFHKSNSSDEFNQLATNIENELKELINLSSTRDNIENFKYENQRNNVKQFIRFLKSPDFKENLIEHIDRGANGLIDKLNLVPILEEMTRKQLSAGRLKYFFRHPYVVSATNKEDQEKIDSITTDILVGNISSFIEIGQKGTLSDYYRYLIIAVLTNLLQDKQKSLVYLKLARGYIDNEDINESYLMEAFIYRTNITSFKDIEYANKSLSKIKPKGEDKTSQFRLKMEKSLIDTTQLVISSLNIIEVPEINRNDEFSRLNTNLQKLYDESNGIFASISSRQRKRLKTQMYMNILTLYIYQKYFLDVTEESLEFDITFFKKKKQVYFTLPFNRRIGYVCIMLRLLDIELGYSSKKKQEAIKCIDQLLEYAKILPYEEMLLIEFQKKLVYGLI